MKKIVFTIVLFSCVMNIWAQDVERKDELKGKASSALVNLRLATDLVKYGYSQQLALPLINALQIILENPTQSLEVEREGKVADTTNMEGKNGIVSLDFDLILADAKEFAAGDEAMLELIEKLEMKRQTEHRGAVNGPLCDKDIVDGNSTVTYQIRFIANSLAEILVSGDGDTDLDLYVYDSNGNLIAKDDDFTDVCYVCWVPAWTGRFIVKIVNRGPVYNRYVLLTN